MARGCDRLALRQIHTVFNTGTIGGLTDGELLERFRSCDLEAAELAFAALIERHGPMVLRVCQSVLHEPHDAEDAFQATFLILVRRAPSIRKQGLVGSWLHGVAFRVASCQKAASARRRRHERRAAEQSYSIAHHEDRQEVVSVLHEELDRLPEKYRAPLVLCNLECLSHEQAASQLSWPVGTVRSRLARGRERLRSRLLRRGLAPSGALMASAILGEAARGAVPRALVTATARAALREALGHSVAVGVTSGSVTVLVRGAMNVMLLSKIKLVLVAFTLVATAAIVAAKQVGTAIPDENSPVRATGASQDRVGQSGVADDDAAVVKEMGRLDLDLLGQEVRDLREYVAATLRDKLRAERSNAPNTNDARAAFEAARGLYLATGASCT